jgi:hypothetical protein
MECQSPANIYDRDGNPNNLEGNWQVATSN